jgi:hypothetical protein
MNVATARRVGATMTDAERRDAVLGRQYAFLVAAVVDGWLTPPDLAGRRSRYAIPRTMPWWPMRERRREARLRALVAGAARSS